MAEEAGSAATSEKRDGSNSKRPQMTLSRKIVIGLTAGIACGLFFGEICGRLSIIGDAYIALMQMTVLPYIVLALIVNIGSLTLDTARHIATRAAVVMLALWGISITVILLMSLALPEWKTGGFFSTSILNPPDNVDFLSLYIPANPFRSLSENLVPAVVVFCICVGIAFIGITRKQSVIEPLRVMLDAMSRVTLWIANLTPYGVFAIAASAAGTITVDEMGRLQAYMIMYISAAFILSFVVLPLAVTSVTPFTYREILNSSRSALLTAFAANNYFIVLPLLIENLKELYRNHGMGGDEVDGTIDITLPIGFPFPNLGRLLALLFIPFGAWFVGRPLEFVQYPLLAVTGLPSFFAKVTVAVPYLLNQFHLPADLFHLFLLSGIINGHVSSMVGAMHLFTFTAITTAVVTGRTRIHPGRTATAIAAAGILVVFSTVATRSYLGWFFSRAANQVNVIEGMQKISDPAPTIALDRAVPNPIPLRDGQSRLDRIRERGTIRVGYLTENLPFSYINANNEVVGFDIEMAHQLAIDLNVTLELVPFDHPDSIAHHLTQDHCDVIMSGIAASPSQFLEVAFTTSYIELTPALVVPDHARNEVDTLDELLQAKDIRLGIVNDTTVMRLVERRLPNAEAVALPRVAAFFEAETPPTDGLVISAEAGSAWTLLYPEFQVVLPFSEVTAWPLGYATAPGDAEFLRFLDLWIDLMRDEGFVTNLRDHWILGRTAVPRNPRWSVIRDVLHWVE
ncbi:MAG: cation:dicarboxylase symporter family transporter [Acidobacteria bacterium]|nr:cation:dicarboxylase symporter family transporter [Candidatus Sulfomarinibacter kjeldsenii]